MKKISKITIVFVTMFVMSAGYLMMREPKMHYDVVVHVKDGSAKWYRNMDFLINLYTDKLNNMSKDNPEYKELEKKVIFLSEELALQKKLDSLQKDSNEYKKTEQKLESVKEILRK